MTPFLKNVYSGVSYIFTGFKSDDSQEDTPSKNFSGVITSQPSFSTVNSLESVQQGSLNRTEEISFISLSILARSARKSKLKTVADKILQKGGIWGATVEWRQFALMLCPGFIRRTTLEGGSLISSIKAALFHLNLYTSEETKFFSGNIPLPVLEKIRSSLNHLGGFLILCPPRSDSPTDKGSIESCAKLWLEEVKNILSSQKSLYLPLGYRDGILNQGHAISCKIAKEGTNVVLTLFNLGNGSDSHPILNYTLNRKKMSYCFFPIRIKKEVFYGDLGKAAFCYLLRYLSDTPPNDSPYDGNDIYDIFCQFFLHSHSESDPSLGPDPKKYEADEQISGNCSEVAVTTIIEDILIDQDISELDRKKYFLNRDLCALIAAHQALSSGNNHHPAAPRLLHEATKFFGSKISSFYSRGDISDQELVCAQAVIHQILKGAEKKISSCGHPEQPTHSKMRPSKGFPLISLFPQAPTPDTLSLDEDTYESIPIPINEPYLEEANGFHIRMDEWVQTANSLPAEKVFQFVSECIRRLPIPLRMSENQEDPWDRVDVGQIKEVLKSLTAFLYRGLKETTIAKYKDRSSLFFDQFMMIYTVYAISDKLARRCNKETKLDNYSSPFFPKPFQLRPNGFTSLPLKEDNDRFTKIQKYFTEKQETSKVIFPIAPILNIHQFVNSQLSSNYTKEELQGIYHIEYLSQFLSQSDSRKTERELAKTYSSKWLAALPVQVKYLYYCSFLSHLLFSAPGKGFPKNLEFSKGTFSGQEVLKIKNPFFLEGESTDSPLFTESYEPKLDHPLKDPRFYTSGKGSNDSFIDLDSPEICSLTTNESLCYALPTENGWNISEADIRTLLNITRRDNLTFWQALQEFSLPRNHHLLNHPGVQILLDRSFFQPGYILERMEQEREILTHTFREFIRENLKRSNDDPSQLSGILFLLRTGISFETYTNPQSYHMSGSFPLELRLFTDEGREPTFLLYKETIEKLLDRPISTRERNDLRLHLCFFNAVYNELDCYALRLETRFADILSSLFEAQIYYSDLEVDYHWLTSNLTQLIRSITYKYTNYFSMSSYPHNSCSHVCSLIFNAITKSTLTDRQSWRGAFPRFSCRCYTLDLFDGTILHRKYGQLKHVDTISLMSDQYPSIKVEEIQKEHGDLVWIDKEGKVVSFDESLQYLPSKKKWEENRLASTHARPTGEFVGFPEGQDGKSFFEWHPRFPWMYVKQNGVVQIYSKKERRPLFNIENKNGSLFYTSLDEKGAPFPFQLANLSAIKHGDHFYEYTVRYAHFNQILCLIHKETDEIHELNFWCMDLQFSKDPKGLKSIQFPGFYLMSHADSLNEREKKVYHQIEEELNKFEGAFILYNDQTDKWIVLLPNSNFSHGADVFSNEVFSNSEAFTTTYNQYAFDSSEKTFKTFNRESKPYITLSLLFKMQNDDEKAYKYLKKIKSSVFFDAATLDHLIQFTKIENYSISSIIFNLNLSLFVINNQHLMLEKQFDNKPESSFYIEFMFWGMKNYEIYLKLSDESWYSQVPAKIDLPRWKKMSLILAFKSFCERYYKNDKKGWESRWTQDHPVLYNQFQVYFIGARENTFTIPPQEIPLHPPIFSSIDFPSSLKSIDFEKMIEAYKKSPENPTQLGDQESHHFLDYPVRMTSLSIQAHFPELYEEARKCKPKAADPFDFILHALIKTSLVSSDSGASLGQLLFWVRHFSDQFASSEFSLKGVTKNTIDSFRETLKRIREKVKSLEKEEKYQGFIATILQRKMKFIMDEAIHIRSGGVQSYPPIPIRKNPPEEKKGDLQKYLEETHHQIHRLFNRPYKVQSEKLIPVDVEQETLFQLKTDSEQVFYFSEKTEKSLEKSLPELLMKQVLLKGNLIFLSKTRGMLTLDQMQELCYLVNEWYHTRVLIECEREGENNPYLPYDYQNYPEISYFYLKTGKFPKPEQLATYQWICEGLAENRNRHFQLPTGCGKTDVITPLLNLRAKQLGLMPISCVTQMAYPIDKENLTYNLRVLEEDLCYLEVGMHMINKLSSQDLKFIFSQLKQYKSEGKGLIIIRYTYDALFLLRDLACRGETDNYLAEERGNKIRWVQNILNFFEEECLLICDESHRNIDPLTKSILGTGPFAPLSEIESHHLLELMKPLLGVYPEQTVLCQDQRDVAEVSFLKKIEHQGNPSPQDIEAIQTALAEYYLKTTTLSTLLTLWTDAKTSASIIKEFFNYWTCQNAPQPTTLKSWGRSQKKEDRQIANLAALTGYFLLILLPDIIKMRTQIDHTRSLYQHRNIEVPCHNKLPTTAEYESYKTVALTIKGNYQRGLNRDDIFQILKDMIQSNSEEESQGFHLYNTPTDKILQEWLAGSELHSFRLRDIVFSNEQMMDKLFNILSNHRSVIEYFLKKYCFPQIGSNSEHLFCTSANTFNGFKKIVAFSATPHDQLANPYDIMTTEDYRQDPSFQSQVKDKLLESNNGQMIIVEGADLFFRSMQERHKTDFEEATVLIDSRGFFSTYSNQQLAKEWLNANPKLDGIFYCMEERSLSVDRDEKICLLLKQPNKILKLDGSNIKAACKEHGLDWERFHFGTIFDPAHIESTNIVQKPNAKAFFFLEDRLTTPCLIQAVMRLRGFLTAGQTITWIVPSDLSQKISKGENLTVRHILDWTDLYKKEQEELRIVLNAFQEIAFVIAKPARERLKHLHAIESKIPDSNMESVIEYFQQVAQGLIETHPRDAYEAFGQHEIKRETEGVLLSFAQSQYSKFNYAISYEENKEVQAAVNGIIRCVKKEIHEIYATIDDLHVSETRFQTASQNALSTRVVQHQATSQSATSTKAVVQHQATSQSAISTKAVVQHQATSQSATSTKAVVQHQATSQSATSTKAVVQHQATSQNATSTRAVQHQEVQTQKQRYQEKQCFYPTPISIDQRFGEIKIYSPKYLGIGRMPVNVFFETSFFAQGFYFLDNYIRTAKLDSSEAIGRYLKPIHFFIICIPNEGGPSKAWADVSSNEIISSTQDDLINCPETVEDLKHTAFLVSAQGHLIQKGCGALKPDEKSIKSVLESRFMKSLVAEAALINGRISDIDYFLDWIKIYGCWKEFERLWSIILRSLPNVETAQTQLYEELKKKYDDPSNLNLLPIRSIEHIFRYNELIQVRDQRRVKLDPPERWHEE